MRRYTGRSFRGIAPKPGSSLRSGYALPYVRTRIKVRDEGTVRNKAVYVALGVRPDGTKKILGLWIEQNEGAKFWLRVMNELKGRGVEDVLIAVVDGLKGFPEAITATFPQAQVQTCVVGLLKKPGSAAPREGSVALARGMLSLDRVRLTGSGWMGVSEPGIGLSHPAHRLP
jgi:putative transposase